MPPPAAQAHNGRDGQMFGAKEQVPNVGGCDQEAKGADNGDVKMKSKLMLLATAAMLIATNGWSPALAADVLSVEPCHSMRVQYDADISEVHPADDTLLDVKVVKNSRLLIVTAKPRTITQTVEKGNQTITTESTSCLNAEGSTTLRVLDANGNEIFPSTPKITSNEVVVRWPGRIVYVNQVAYHCAPQAPCRRL
jgi:hypothetical protein